MSRWDVDRTACQTRQRRLMEQVDTLGVDLVILTRSESIQWATGAYVGPLFAPVATLDASGRVTLVLPKRKLDQVVAADRVVGYEAKLHSTIRDDQRAASTAVLVDALQLNPRRVACEFSSFGQQLERAWSAELVDVEPTLFRLRRRKDPDELAMLARANEANRAMYQLAREIIRPGVIELDVYSQLHTVAVHELGEPLTYFGQDFRSGERGGVPRDRRIEAGELYILDLGVGFRGYYSDNARTIAVDGKPTEKQRHAWQKVSEVFPLVESEIKPGVSCRGLFEQVSELLGRASPWLFNHHLGHGVGLAPHEGPHLNPNWDDTFEEGDYIAVEPGLYHDDLRHGVRLEQNYLVTAEGAKLLTDWLLEL